LPLLLLLLLLLTRSKTVVVAVVAVGAMLSNSIDCFGSHTTDGSVEEAITLTYVRLINAA